MHIKTMTVRNFRGLDKIDFAPGSGLNVIAGPNAVGKTTILEAIRLTKSLLAQRFPGEANQVLHALGGNPNPSLGANSQIAALAGNANQPIMIDILIELDATEISKIKNSASELGFMLLQTQLARSLNDSVVDFTQFLSTPDGQAKLEESHATVLDALKVFSQSTPIHLGLYVDTFNSQIRGADANSQTFLIFLERSLSPAKTYFNYFSADRAMPVGEVAIQLGAGDVAQQITSYLAQPSTKYARIKQLIVQTMLLDKSGRETLENEFNLIFDNLLPGKKLSGVSFNEHGVLRVLVEDKETGKIFDIDSMSSGEKGLVLTFLTLRLSSKNDSIVMIDEPELHLNAAVSSRIVRFLMEHCVQDMGLQLFICSHSPEVVRDAFELPECRLFHLRSSTDLSPVLQQDSGEVFEILNRLGSNTADILFNRGTIFVEGEHDAAILQAGYPTTLQGFKIQSLGGRSEIEKEIPLLQAAEKSSNLKKIQLFIFDMDRNISKLRSSDTVRVQQLKRYCIENYLLDEVILFDIISANSNKFNESRGTFPTTLEEIALSQLDQYVLQKAYAGLEPANAGIRPKEVRGLDFHDAAPVLWNRIQEIREQVSNLDAVTWQNNFVSVCLSEKSALEASWKIDWKSLASGKQIIDDLYVRYEITLKKVDFKRSVIKSMADSETDTWRVLDSLLKNELS